MTGATSAAETLEHTPPGTVVNERTRPLSTGGGVDSRSGWTESLPPPLRFQGWRHSRPPRNLRAGARSFSNPSSAPNAFKTQALSCGKKDFYAF